MSRKQTVHASTLLYDTLTVGDLRMLWQQATVCLRLIDQALTCPVTGPEAFAFVNQLHPVIASCLARLERVWRDGGAVVVDQAAAD